MSAARWRANIEPYDAPEDGDLRAYVATHFPWWADDLVAADLPALTELHRRIRQALTTPSPGGTRRYCSDSCANRANVAAWRARKRAAAEQDD